MCRYLYNGSKKKRKNETRKVSKELQVQHLVGRMRGELEMTETSIDYCAKEIARIGKDIIHCAAKLRKEKPERLLSMFLNELKCVIRIIEEEE